MPCARCGKYWSVGITLTLVPVACTSASQSGTPAMPADFPVATDCQTPTGPACWMLASSCLRPTEAINPSSA